MSNIGVKTPVSCLQEYLVSKKMVPHYELIHNKVGTHNPEFTFRVQVGALWEEGTARSKQEAKHRAAEKMLKSLKVVDEKVDEEVTSKWSIDPAENYVGQLKELCFLQHYPEPNYYLEEAAGPDHSRIFKMVCCVSQLQDFGVSRTKKQAKHEAAFKMLQRLKEVASKKVDKVEVAVMNLGSPLKVQSKTTPVSVTDDEVTEKYNAVKYGGTTVCKDPAVFYKDHHKAYVHLHEKSPTLVNLLTGSCVASVENSLSLVQEITKELEMSLQIIKVPSKEKDTDYTVMSMSVFPPVAAVGVSKDLAAFNLIESLLILCKE